MTPPVTPEWIEQVTAYFEQVIPLQLRLPPRREAVLTQFLAGAWLSEQLLTSGFNWDYKRHLCRLHGQIYVRSGRCPWEIAQELFQGALKAASVGDS